MRKVGSVFRGRFLKILCEFQRFPKWEFIEFCEEVIQRTNILMHAVHLILRTFFLSLQNTVFKETNKKRLFLVYTYNSNMSQLLYSKMSPYKHPSCRKG